MAIREHPSIHKRTEPANRLAPKRLHRDNLSKNEGHRHLALPMRMPQKTNELFSYRLHDPFPGPCDQHHARPEEF